MSKKVTKLGLDFHGVIDHNPELFTHMAKMYDEVHIITGGSFKLKTFGLEKSLMKIGGGQRWWTHEFSVYDYLESIKAETNADLGIKSRHPYPDDTWNIVKAKYCLENKIDLHIDDMPQYLQYFSTPTMLYKLPFKTVKQRQEEAEKVNDIK